MVAVILLGFPLSGGEGVPRASEAVGVPPVMASSGHGFLENIGQLSNSGIRYYAMTPDMVIGFTVGAVLFVLTEPRSTPGDAGLEHGPRYPDVRSSRGVAIRVSFQGAIPVEPEGRGELPHRSHFFLGNDSALWRTNVRSFQEMLYRELWPGIDLLYRLTEEGPKYEFLVREGARYDDIRLTYTGVEGLSLDSSGDLIVATTLGFLRDTAPEAYRDGLPASCAFSLPAPRTVGFRCVLSDAHGMLRIDPVFHATFLGGVDFDRVWAVTVDDTGNSYVAGETQSPDFPVNPGAFNTSLSGGRDAYVAKLSSDLSTLLYATFLGGARWDRADAIAVDDAGSAYVTGETFSPDFPTTPVAFDRTCGTNGLCNGYSDAFVAELRPNGSALVYSTFLGGNVEDFGYSVVVGNGGEAYVTGFVGSVDFPTTPGAFDASYNGAGDVFVVRLTSTGADLVFSTFLGGTGIDVGDGEGSIAVDDTGSIYVTGGTNSSDFPTTPGAFDTSFNGAFAEHDAFVAKLGANGSALTYSTYLGGTRTDSGESITVDSTGSAYVAVGTLSPEFPTTPGAFDRTFSGDFWLYDGIVAKLSPNGGALVYSTFLGGNDSDVPYALALDLGGNLYVAGYTDSVDFPTTPDAFDRTLGGSEDGFLAELDETGGALRYGTFLGGDRGQDRALSIARTFGGSLYIAGWTVSADFPATPGAFETLYPGGLDGFVAAFLQLPDLVITPADLTVVPPNPPIGLVADFVVNITNVGEGGVRLFTTTAFEDRDLDGQVDPGEPFDNRTAGPLMPLNRLTLFLQWIPDTGGTHRMCASADPLDMVLETNEGNNSACIDVVAVPGPERRPDYVPWQPEPNGAVSVGLSLPVNLSLEVRNVGNGSAASVSTLSFRNESMPSFATFTVAPLAPLEVSSRFTTSWVSAVPGTYRVAANVDAGNAVLEWDETNNAYTWTIDVVPGPITTLVLGQPNVTFAVTYVTSSTPLALSVLDQGATGIRRTMYRIDGRPWTNFTATDPFTLDGEGEHFLEWFSEDWAGNVEATQAVRLRVDDTPPSTSIVIGTPKYQSVGLFVTSSTQISLAAADGGATPVGLAITDYRLGGNPWYPYVSAFTLTGNDGPKAIDYRSTDLLGHVEAIRTIVLVLDNAPPSTSIVVGAPKYQGTDLYVTTATPISLGGPDSGAPAVGLSFLEYRVDGPSWSPYTYPFSLTGIDGTKKIEYRSTDLLGNVETVRTLRVVLDNNPPTTSISPSGPPFPVGTPFALSATDGGSGLSRTEYRIDGGDWILYSAPFTVPDGGHVIGYRSRDNLGNAEAERTLVVPAEVVIPAEFNWKPLLALAFTVILLAAGAWSSTWAPWKGQKGRRPTAKAFAVFYLPFVLMEGGTGVVSLLTGLLSIPPLLGTGTAVDLTILLTGIAAAMYRGMKGRSQ